MLRSFAFVLIALLAFVLPAFFIEPDSMTEFLSAGLFIACGFGIYRWGAAAGRVFAKGSRTRESWGILAVVGLLGALAAQRVYSVAYIQMGRPEWMQLLHISPFITYVMLISVVLFILATTFEGERPSPLGGIAAAIIAFVGVLASHFGPMLLTKLGALSHWFAIFR